MNERCFDVDPAARLDDVLEWCIRVRKVDRLILATRLDADASSPRFLKHEVADTVMELFGSEKVCMSLVHAWPGTRLIEQVGVAFELAFDDWVRKVITRAANVFSEWTQWNEPALPEDICLYRDGDKFPTLVSVTHDGDAWVLSENLEPKLGELSNRPLPMDLVPPGPRFLVPKERTELV